MTLVSAAKLTQTPQEKTEHVPKDWQRVKELANADYAEVMTDHDT